MFDIFMLSETDYTTALTTLVATTTSVAASTSTVTATTIDDNDTPEKEAEEDIILPADSNSESDSSSAVSLPYFMATKKQVTRSRPPIMELWEQDFSRLL